MVLNAQALGRPKESKDFQKNLTDCKIIWKIHKNLEDSKIIQKFPKYQKLLIITKKS